MKPLHPDRAPIPPGVRAAVLKRAHSRCEVCGDQAPLEMHHTTYRCINLPGVNAYYVIKHGPDLIFGHETPDVLRALCRDCHHQAHMTPWGEFIGDIDERDEQVEHWHWIMEKD